MHEHDPVIREVGTRLMEHLEPVQLSPRALLDLGAGHGLLREPLKARWPDARQFAQDLSPALLANNRPRWPWQARPSRVVGHAEALPWRDGSLDLVVSNLALAGASAFKETLEEIARVQPPGGLVALTTLGPDSFRELAAAWSAIDPAVRLPLMPDMHDQGDVLADSGYTGVVMDCETLTVTYASAAEALAELRALGVHNHGPDRPRGLRGRNVESRLAAHLAPDADGRIPVTLEVVYAHAWRGEARGSATVSLQ